VTVEYPEGKPEISRIKGLRVRPFDAGPMLVVIFPLVGLGVMVPGLLMGHKANRLLATGMLGLGRLKSKEATNMKVNDRTVYKLTFEYEAHDGATYEVVAKTSNTENLTDDEYEGLLYDPYRPSYAVMMDSLPGSPKIDGLGHIRSGHPLRDLAALLLPAVVFVGHGIAALVLLTG